MSDIEQSVIPSHPSEHSCVDFMNSSFSDYLGSDEQIERLTAPRWQRWFLARHGLTPQRGLAAPLADLVALRRDLRRILTKWSHHDSLAVADGRLLDRWIRNATVRHRVSVRNFELELGPEPLTRDWTWVMASVAMSAVTLIQDGDPLRLKTCGNPHCSWMFYDNTINRSKQFCSTTPCGSLIRVRRFRDRLST